MKKYLPKGIYGRVILILLLPIIGVQFIVSVVFIQRHFEDITRQMSSGVASEILLISTSAPVDRSIAHALGFKPILTSKAQSRRDFFDLSGRFVAQVFEDRIPNLVALDLCVSDRGCAQKQVAAFVQTPDGILRLSFSRDRVSAANPHQLLVIMVVLGAVLTLVSFLYLRNQLRPIARLSTAASAYGRGEIVPYRIRGASEVRAAGAAFLEMRGRIERQNQTRRTMLSGISHDLRAPLTRLRMAIEMDDGPQAGDMRRDVEEMQQMLDAFLDYTRDVAEDRDELCAPEDILRAAAHDGARAGTDVIVTRCDDVADMRLRPMAIRRALDNLILNAGRYGTHVHVSLQATQKVIRFCVEDDGPGIPSSLREEMRRPFTRRDPARNQDQGSGVGLGLSIVEDVARAHGGRLDLGDSPSLGGLSASLILPK